MAPLGRALPPDIAGTTSAAPSPPGARHVEASRRPRPHELLTAGYFALTGIFVAAFGSPLARWWPTLVLHVALVAGILLVLPRIPERGWLAVLRDWLPIVAFSLIYVEIAELNDLFTQGYYDRGVLRLEALLFGTQPSVVLRELVPSKALSEYLHFGYVAYYAIGPAVAGSLYLQGRRDAMRYAVTVTFAVYFACYLIFITYPVAGPWYVFTRPDPDQMGWFFPQLEHALLEGGASEGAAFPSSHVAAAVVLWLLAWRLSRSVFVVLSPIVPALVVGTVYGGFHYAVDALAGVALGIAGYAAGPWIQRALGGEVPDPESPGATASHPSPAAGRRKATHGRSAK